MRLGDCWGQMLSRRSQSPTAEAQRHAAAAAESLAPSQGCRIALRHQLLDLLCTRPDSSQVAALCCTLHSQLVACFVCHKLWGHLGQWLPTVHACHGDSTDRNLTHKLQARTRSLSTQGLAGTVFLVVQVLCQTRIPVWLGPQPPSATFVVRLRRWRASLVRSDTGARIESQAGKRSWGRVRVLAQG